MRLAKVPGKGRAVFAADLISKDDFVLGKAASFFALFPSFLDPFKVQVVLYLMVFVLIFYSLYFDMKIVFLCHVLG